MNLSLSDVWFVALVALIVACGLAGLGELRDWLSEGRELDRVRRLAALDNAMRTPVTRPLALGDLVIPDPDPALGCRYCGPPFEATAACTCAAPCGDGFCGALAWGAVSNTEEWER